MVYPGDELRPILAQEDEDDGEKVGDETEEKELEDEEPDEIPDDGEAE